MSKKYSKQKTTNIIKYKTYGLYLRFMTISLAKDRPGSLLPNDEKTSI